MFEHYYILYTKKEPKIDKTETSIKFSETRYRYGKIDENNKKAFWDNFGKTESLKSNSKKRLNFYNNRHQTRQNGHIPFKPR